MTTVAIERTDPKDVVVEWIDHILERKRWNGTDLARHCDLAPSTILRIINDENHRFTPSFKTIQKISNGTGYPIPQKIMDALGVGSEPKEDDPSGDGGGSSRTGRPAPRKGSTLKVKNVSALPSSLMPIAREQEVVVDCPKPLEGDETAFAFYMPGNSLEPWLKAGTKMYATMRRDPAAGDMILVTDKEGRSRVRLLVDINENGLALSKSHPVTEDEHLTFDQIEDIAIVAVIEMF